MMPVKPAPMMTIPCMHLLARFHPRRELGWPTGRQKSGFGAEDTRITGGPGSVEPVARAHGRSSRSREPGIVEPVAAGPAAPEFGSVERVRVGRVSPGRSSDPEGDRPVGALEFRVPSGPP